MRLTGHHGIRRQSTFPVDFVDEQHQAAERSQKGRVRFNVSVPGQARVTREHVIVWGVGKSNQESKTTSLTRKTETPREPLGEYKYLKHSPRFLPASLTPCLILVSTNSRKMPAARSNTFERDDEPFVEVDPTGRFGRYNDLLALNKVVDPEVKAFILKCIAEPRARPSASDLLKDAFFSGVNDEETVPATAS
ncbi:hypothetical protein OIU77_011066 [Salix suchowensis]|uniref:non-specific serine/threonine protein kinase n=1 Tax=Salix suchowensis TaxID=1278906 RepID=A0ABQ9AAH0_9ROSI|nr:hypothetical protein OIU77_011066 [Salix suchowensis]